VKAVSWTEVTADFWYFFLDSPLRIFCSIGRRFKGSLDLVGIDGIHIELNCILRASAHGVITAHTVYEKSKALTLPFSVSIDSLSRFETFIFTAVNGRAFREDLTRATTTSHHSSISTLPFRVQGLEVRQNKPNNSTPITITIATLINNVKRTLQHSRPRHKCRRLNALKKETLHPTRYIHPTLTNRLNTN
jgi:hypothetical protein